MLRTVVVAVSLVWLAVGMTPASAVDPAGTAVRVTQSAAATGTGGARALETNGAVFMGDRVATDAVGQAQLRFADDTRMVVGPNSNLTIDSFVYAGPATAKQVTVNAARGTFRFITGQSAKSAYEINTPIATIGVRGTALDFDVADDGTATVVIYPHNGVQSEVYYCDKAKPRRHCATVTGWCSLVILTPDRQFRWVKDVTERTNLMDKLFPEAFRQSDLDPSFRVSSAACDSHDVSVPETPEDKVRPEPEDKCEGDECDGREYY